MEYSRDGKKMIMTAFNRGQSDLYLYHVPGNNHEQLTKDIWDETSACFADGGKTVVFSSNRNSDTLRIEEGNTRMPDNNDLFLFDLESRNPVMRRLTKTPQVDEIKPRAFKDKHYTFLSNDNGYYNSAVATIDSTISNIDTAIHYRYYTSLYRLSDLHRHTIDHYVLPEAALGFQVYQKNGSPWVTWGKNPSLTVLQPNGESEGEKPSKTPLIFLPHTAAPSINIKNYVFESERLDYVYEKESPQPSEAITDDEPSILEIPKSKNYRLNFAADQAIAQANNNFFNPTYQNYTGQAQAVFLLEFQGSFNLG